MFSAVTYRKGPHMDATLSHAAADWYDRAAELHDEVTAAIKAGQVDNPLVDELRTLAQQASAQARTLHDEARRSN